MPRNNKLYSYIAPVRPFYRYVLTIFILGILVYSWLHGIYFYLNATIEQYEKEISSLSKQRRTIKQTEQSDIQLQESIEGLHQVVRSYRSNSSGYDSLQERMLFIFKTAKDVDLQLNTYKADEHVNKNWYQKGSMHFEFTGTIRQGIQFFDKLKSSQKMIQCKNINCTHLHHDLFTITCDLQMFVVA